MRRIWLLVLATALACGGDSAGPKTAIAGTWRLQTINGQPLPFVREEPGSSKIELTSDVYTLADNGAFTKLMSVRVTTNGQVSTTTISETGTYVLDGTAVTVHYNTTATSVTGSWQGNTIAIAAEGFPGIYTR